MNSLNRAERSPLASIQPVGLDREAVLRPIHTHQRYLSRRLPGSLEELGQATQVHHGHRERKHLLCARQAPYLQLPKPPVLLGVAKDRLDQLANDLAHRVTGVARRTRIDGASALRGV